MILKHRVTLDDSVQIYLLHKQFAEVKGTLGRWLLVRRILLVLCESVWLWQVTPKNFMTMLEKAGFIGGESTSDGSKAVHELAAWIGANLHKTPNEVLTGTTKDEVVDIYNAILAEKIDRSVMQAMAQHDTKGLNEEIQKLRQIIVRNKMGDTSEVRKQLTEARKRMIEKRVTTTENYRPSVNVNRTVDL